MTAGALSKIAGRRTLPSCSGSASAPNPSNGSVSGPRNFLKIVLYLSWRKNHLWFQTIRTRTNTTMNTRTMSPEQIQETQAATLLHSKLAAINITEVPVMTLDRCIPNKEQAKMARNLFRTLGLTGISVKTPAYSMANGPEVRLPRRSDHNWAVIDADNNFGRCAAHQANCQARTRVLAILLAAFPQHDDRSELQSDYHDSCWNVS